MDKDIISSLLLREGIENKELITDMVNDCIQELKDYLNYEDKEVLPDSTSSIVKELVLIRYNRDGAEGIQSEGFSGVSTSYMDDIPKALKRRINAKRRLPRCNHVN